MSPVPSTYLRLSIAAATIAVALLIGAVGLMLWDTRQTAWTKSAESLSNLTLSLEHDLSRNLGSYKLLLDAVADGRRPPEEPASMEADWRLFSGPIASDLFGTIFTTDAQGRVIHSSRPIPPGLDMAAKSYFTEQRDDANRGVIFGKVEHGRRSGRPIIPFSRRMSGPDGQFAGVVVGNVKLNYFKQAFADFRLGSGGTIALLTTDGRLMAGSPMRETAVGADLSASAVMERLRTAGPGIFEAKSVVDGETRLYSARAVTNLPLYVLAGTSVRGIYGDWMARLWATCVGVACFVAILTCVAVALRRELHRRTHAELQVKASAAELQLIADTIDDLVLKLDWEGKPHFVSPASMQLMGMAPHELQGGNTLALVHPEDRQKVASALDCMRYAHNTSHLVVYRVQHKDGHWRHVEARGRALPDASGAIIVARDVSERIQLEDQLRQAQRMEAIGALTAGVAHDFNNLLQCQVASLELLLDSVAGQKNVIQYATMALDAAERGAQLTHSLLAFSRKQVLRPEPVRLADLLARISGMLSRTIQPNIQLRVEVQPDLAPPFADPSQLEAAVLNLCLNGRDAMQDHGGHLLIEAFGVVDSTDGGGSRRCVVVAITDNGSGMDAATLARAREPFFTTKGLGKGTGLGLSMAEGFARQSGGELRIQSRPNVGTRMEIWLPEAVVQARSTNEGALAPSLGANRSNGGRRVLLVDDDPGVLSMIGDMLGVAGFMVGLATDGDTALSMLRKERFDVLVTDYAMPGMNGGELVGIVRRSHPGLPALIVTGYADDTQLVPDPTEVEVLRKPFRMDDLIGRINALMTARDDHPTKAAFEHAQGGRDRLVDAAA